MKNKNRNYGTNYGMGDPRKDSNAKNRLLYEGTVVEPLKNILFKVRLDLHNHMVMGYLSGNMIRHRIRVILGDRVVVELNEYDFTKGRILYRLPPQEDTTSPESSLDTENSNPTSNDPPQSTDSKDIKP